MEKVLSQLLPSAEAVPFLTEHLAATTTATSET
jgi:hypothetical protein